MSGVKQDTCKACHQPKIPGEPCKPCRDANKKRNYEKQKQKYIADGRPKKVYPERICGDCGVTHNEQTSLNRCAKCRHVYERKMYQRKKKLALQRSDDTVTCSRCGTTRFRFQKNGVKTSCKPCSDKWRQDNREYILQYQRETIALKRKENPEKYKAIQEKHKKQNPESVKFQQVKSKVKKFGITIEEYADMVKAQNNLCAICKNPETMIVSKKDPVPRALAVDHDHITGKVRGLLCAACNQGIGAYKDDPMLMCAAAEYVQYHSVPAWA